MEQNSTLDYLSEMSPDELLEYIKEEEARKGLLDFIMFTKEDYEPAWFHEIVCSEIDSFLESETDNRLIITISPRRGKSEIVSRRTPAYVLGKNPNTSIIVASYSADLAQRINRDVQRIIDSPKYRILFPETTLSGKNVKTTSLGSYVRTSDLFEIVGYKGALRSAGVGGGITGTGADLAVIDDPFKDWQDAYSPRYRQMIKDWYSSTLYTRLSPKGKVIIIHTRWHEDDLIGWLLKEAEANPEADQWKVVNLPEIQDEHNNYPHPKDQRQHGEVLWSGRYSLEHVNKIKNSVGSKVFNALYQQRPTTDGGQIIKAEWIQYFKELPEIDYYIASWDCAFKDTKTSDFVVGTVWAVCGSNKYLVYLVRERMGITETMKQMIIVSKKFDLRYQVIEDKANGPAIIQMLKNKIPALLAFNPEGSKEARANAVAPQFEAGNIWIPSKYVEKNREQFGTVIAKLDEYVNELTTFPNGANDDMVDSTTQALLKIGYKSDWLEEIISRANAKEKDAVDIKTKVVADLMGWNIQEQESSIFDDLMDEDMFKVDF